jgi:pyruvate ferredoxin oxidoreductase delta subunit
VDIAVCVDDTLCKGVESWAWYGLQPINRLTHPGGTLLITSKEPAENLIPMIHQKHEPYKLAVLKGTASFSGLWVYKDDHTDVRILGAIAKLLPEMMSLDSVKKFIMHEWKDAVKAQSATNSYNRVTSQTVSPSQGSTEKPFEFVLPKWHEMGDGVAIPCIKPGHQMEDPNSHAQGGYQPARNHTFKKYTTRTMRPVVDFDTCIKCTLCWLQCPDSCFDVTPEGLYDANMEACCGCGVCEAVCPVKDCVTMVNEVAFKDNSSQWEDWRENKETYKTWLKSKIADHPVRSHGFRYRGQYAEQTPEMLEIAKQG